MQGSCERAASFIHKELSLRCDTVTPTTLGLHSFMPSAAVRLSHSMETDVQRGNTEKMCTKTTETLLLVHGYTSNQPSFVGFPLAKGADAS